MNRMGYLLLSALLAISCDLRDRRCRELEVEMAVPRGSGIVQRYDLVTPESMSGHGGPEVVRSDEINDFYSFETLVFNDESRRDFVVGLNDGRSAVISLPNGQDGTVEFSPWITPTFVAQADDVTWNVMHGYPTTRLTMNEPVRLRYRFSSTTICQQ